MDFWNQDIVPGVEVGMGEEACCLVMEGCGMYVDGEIMARGIDHWITGEVSIHLFQSVSKIKLVE
jgi:hypothetical protein